MEIILGKTAGFCFGVENAVKKTETELKNQENAYCLGEVVHNKQLVEDLKNKGLVIVDENSVSNCKNNRIIIRAHGISKKVYEEIENLKIELIDLTCPKVLKIHEIAENYANKGYYIFLIGQSNHPERVGTRSYCGDYFSIIEKLEDVDNSIAKVKKDTPILIIAQTTFDLNLFNEIAEYIKSKIKNVEMINTICSATRVRQEETANLSKQVDLMIIVGGKKSSNTNKLYEISKKYCESLLVETREELNKNYLKGFNKVGIMAGASTPKKSIEQVVDFLENIC
jgi:4-hydroxy-3-methylbut-2-enyl diphosphate reductase